MSGPASAAARSGATIRTVDSVPLLEEHFGCRRRACDRSGAGIHRRRFRLAEHRDPHRRRYVDRRISERTDGRVVSRSPRVAPGQRRRAFASQRARAPRRAVLCSRRAPRRRRGSAAGAGIGRSGYVASAGPGRREHCCGRQRCGGPAEQSRGLTLRESEPRARRRVLRVRPPSRHHLAPRQAQDLNPIPRIAVLRYADANLAIAEIAAELTAAKKAAARELDEGFFNLLALRANLRTTTRCANQSSERCSPEYGRLSGGSIGRVVQRCRAAPLTRLRVRYRRSR